ncbi:MAG: hypothetical protein ACXWP5_08330 [Bdellovibrionota bacterium]
MKFFTIVLLALLASPISLSAAETCPNIRLDQGSGSMAQVAAFNQGHEEICAVYASAGAIDAYRFSHGDTEFSHLTSPLALLLGTKLEEGQTGFSLMNGGGGLRESLAFVAKYGSCSHAHFPNPDVPRNFANQIDPLISVFQNYRSYAFAGGSVSDQLGDFFLGKSTERILKRSILEIQKALRSAQFSPDMIPSAELLEDFLNEEYHQAFLRHILQYACLDDLVQMPPGLGDSDHAVTLVKWRFPPKLSELTDLLQAPNAQPVVIHYSAYVLEKGKSYRPAIDGTNNHASLVIGSRQSSSGQCQLLVRNSWGTTCRWYSSDWECDGRGDVWVDADFLLQAIGGGIEVISDS